MAVCPARCSTSPSTRWRRRRLYVTTHLHGLFASDDGGASWRRLDDRGTGLPRTGYFDVDVDPRDSRTLYASSLCGPSPATSSSRSVASSTAASRSATSIRRPRAACTEAPTAGRAGSSSSRRWVRPRAWRCPRRAPEAHLRRRRRVVACGSASTTVPAGGRRTTGLGTTSVDRGRGRRGPALRGHPGLGRVRGHGRTRRGHQLGRSEQPSRLCLPRPGRGRSARPRAPLRLGLPGWRAAQRRRRPHLGSQELPHAQHPGRRPRRAGLLRLDIDPADPETVWLGVYGKGLIGLARRPGLRHLRERQGRDAARGTHHLRAGGSGATASTSSWAPRRASSSRTTEARHGSA